MTELSSILAVVGLFMLRIGVPVVVLITLGVLIDRWQNRRNTEIQRLYGLQSDIETTIDETEQVEAAADAAEQADEQHKVA